MKLRKSSPFFCAICVVCFALVSQSFGSPADLEVVKKRLDPTQPFQLWMDLEDLNKRTVQTASAFNKLIGNEVPELANNSFDVAAFTTALGMNQVKAHGTVSEPYANSYLNKSYHYIPGGVKGVLQVFSGAPVTFTVQNVALPNADFAIQSRLNLAGAYKSMQAAVLQMFGAEGQEMLDEMLSTEVLEGVPLTMGECVKNIDGAFHFIATLYEKESKPDAYGDTEMEYTRDFCVGFDKASFIYDRIAMSAGSVKERSGNYDVCIFNYFHPEAEDGDPLRYAAAKHQGTGQVWISNSKAYLISLISDGSKLGQSGDYKYAMDLLPTSGSFMGYSSMESMRKYNAMAAARQWSTGENPLFGVLGNYAMMAADMDPDTFVGVAETNGIYMTSWSKLPLNATLNAFPSIIMNLMGEP
jgi:hypothetical protein